jgi:hypothetical protein
VSWPRFEPRTSRIQVTSLLLKLTSLVWVLNFKLHTSVSWWIRFNSYTAYYVSGSNGKYYMHHFLAYKWKQKTFRYQILPITLSTCTIPMQRGLQYRKNTANKRITEPSFNMTIWYVQIKWMLETDTPIYQQQKQSLIYSVMPLYNKYQ